MKVAATDHLTQLTVIRARLMQRGVPRASLDALEADVAGQARARGADALVAVADRLQALVELELRLLGFDTNVLRTPEGIAEAKAVAELCKAARAGKLSAAQRKELRKRVQADPDHLKRLLARGALVEGKWRPLATLRDVLALERALEER